MRSSKARIAVLLIILVGAALGARTLLKKGIPVPVEVEPVRRGHVEATVTAVSSGTVEAKVDSIISSEFMGSVMKINFDEGDTVDEGALVVELDARELDAQVKVAEANLAAGRARLEQAKVAAEIQDTIAGTDLAQAEAQLRNAEEEFDRAESLLEQGVVAKSFHDRAELARDVARELFAAAKKNELQKRIRREEIKSAEANVEQLKSSLEYTNAQLAKARVTAPFRGVIAEMLVDIGESMASGSAGAGAGALMMRTPLFRLVNMDAMTVRAPIDEVDSDAVTLGMEARVTLEPFPDTELLGEVTYIAPVVKTTLEQNRTVDIKVELKEGLSMCRPGMSADVTVLLSSKNNILYVPSDAVMSRPDGDFVRAIADGLVVDRKVELGLTNWDTSEVLAGLDEGEPVIVSLDIRGLKEGVRVVVAAEETGRSAS
jgi:HlyD family secretion protein